jgi:hypothetical protein
MARPLAQGLSYFPHDCDASNDEKIEALELLYGADGYAFYFKLLERIYRTNNAELDISDAETRQIIIRKLKVDEQKFNKMLETALRHGCFDAAEYRTRQVLTSVGIKKRAGTVETKRLKMREAYEERLRKKQQEQQDDKSPTAPTEPQDPASISDAETTPESAQRKEKESKGKESKADLIHTHTDARACARDHMVQGEGEGEGDPLVELCQGKLSMRRSSLERITRDFGPAEVAYWVQRLADGGVPAGKDPEALIRHYRRRDIEIHRMAWDPTRKRYLAAKKITPSQSEEDRHASEAFDQAIGAILKFESKDLILDSLPGGTRKAVREFGLDRLMEPGDVEKKYQDFKITFLKLFREAAKAVRGAKPVEGGLTQ